MAKRNKWSKEEIERQTRSSASMLRDALNRAENAREDKQADWRALRRECVRCYYFGGTIAGQAFTEYTCQNCARPGRHPNTAVPRFCESCSDKRNLCVRCGGHRNAKDVE